MTSTFERDQDNVIDELACAILRSYMSFRPKVIVRTRRHTHTHTHTHRTDCSTWTTQSQM